MRSKLGYCVTEGPKSKKPTLKNFFVRPNMILNAVIGLDNAEVEFTKNTSNRGIDLSCVIDVHELIMNVRCQSFKMPGSNAEINDPHLKTH